MSENIQLIPTSTTLEKRHRASRSTATKAFNQNDEREECHEQFRDEMEDVWVDYQQTGLHVRGEEVFAWVNSWFSDDEKPVPRCRTSQRLL